MSSPQGVYWATESFQLPTATKLTVFFQMLPVRMGKKSEEAGYDVYEDRVHIVKLPADATLRVCRIPTAEDKKEYAALYKEFLKTKETRIPGIPIEQWPHITDAQKLTFKAMGVMTVEQFANLSDGYGQNIMGFQDLRRKAQEFVKVGASQDLIADITAKANARVAEVEAKMAKMEAMLEQLTKPEEVA